MKPKTLILTVVRRHVRPRRQLHDEPVARQPRNPSRSKSSSSSSPRKISTWRSGQNPLRHVPSQGLHQRRRSRATASPLRRPQGSHPQDPRRAGDYPLEDLYRPTIRPTPSRTICRPATMLSVFASTSRTRPPAGRRCPCRRRHHQHGAPQATTSRATRTSCSRTCWSSRSTATRTATRVAGPCRQHRHVRLSPERLPASELPATSAP